MKLFDGEYDNQTQRVLDNYFANAELTSAKNWFLINNLVDNAASQPLQYLLKNPELFYKKYGIKLV